MLLHVQLVKVAHAAACAMAACSAQQKKCSFAKCEEEKNACDVQRLAVYSVVQLAVEVTAHLSGNDRFIAPWLCSCV